MTSYGFVESYELQNSRNSSKICKHIFVTLLSNFGLIV